MSVDHTLKMQASGVQYFGGTTIQKALMISAISAASHAPNSNCKIQKALMISAISAASHAPKSNYKKNSAKKPSKKS